MPQHSYLKIQCKSDNLVDDISVQKHVPPYLDVGIPK